jgi:hypothetical protein
MNPERILPPSGGLQFQHPEFQDVETSYQEKPTNPLVDFIARMFFAGYKNKTDLHYANYSASNMPRL